MTSIALHAHARSLTSRLSVTTGIMLVAGVVASVAVASRASAWQEQLVLAAGLLVLTFIAVLDVHTLRAPNRIVYPAAIAIVLGFAALGVGSAIDAAAAGAMSFGILLFCVILGRGSMGYGDAKVGFLCGSLVGLAGVLPMLLATFFVGGCFAAIMMMTGRKSRRDVVAFTPFLLTGVVATCWLSLTEGTARFV